jgi:hypothetical protein
MKLRVTVGSILLDALEVSCNATKSFGDAGQPGPIWWDTIFWARQTLTRARIDIN